MSAEPAATAAKAIAAALLRHALTAAGAALVAHRYVDHATADSAIGPIGDYVLGAGLAIGAAGWGVGLTLTHHLERARVVKPGDRFSCAA